MQTIPRRADRFHPGSRVVVTGPTDTGHTGTVETTSPGTARVRMDDRERPAVFPLYDLGRLAGDDADAVDVGRRERPQPAARDVPTPATLDTVRVWLDGARGDGHDVLHLLELATTRSLAYQCDDVAREYAAAWKLLNDRMLAGGTMLGLAVVDGRLVERPVTDGAR